MDKCRNKYLSFMNPTHYVCLLITHFSFYLIAMTSINLTNLLRLSNKYKSIFLSLVINGLLCFNSNSTNHLYKTITHQTTLLTTQ